jgi:hypothetical protein
MSGAVLPELPYGDWRATKDTLHLYVQQVGKLKLASTPRQNHWWNVTLAVDARGLTSGRMHAEGTSFDVAFDLVDHALVARTDRGGVDSFPLRDGLSVAAFNAQLLELLGGLGVEAAITPMPFGVPVTTPFAVDVEHASYDPEFVARFWQALSWIDWVFREFAGLTRVKTSPVQLFWHSLDLAVTRFSGRVAPAAPGADPVTAEAYSHEVISFGFWPGDEQTPSPSFYSYTAPEPAGLTDRPLAEGARWTDAGTGTLALLPYDSVRGAPDPRAALLAFLQSAFDAGTAAAHWPTEQPVDTRPPTVG